MTDYLTPFLGAEATISSARWGRLTMEAASFSPAIDGDLVVRVGDPFSQTEPLVRIHSECLFGDVFHSQFCDCGTQLEMAMDQITAAGHGMLFYLRFDGRGAGLAAKVKATQLEVDGTDTFESRIAIGVQPEGRSFGQIAAYLKAHGVKRLRLLTNNPLKATDLEREGVQVSTIPLLLAHPGADVRRLYRTKAQKFHHSIPGLLTES